MTRITIIGAGQAIEYGCEKPTTTSTLTNHVIANGAHDLTYSYVTFNGYTNVGGVGRVVHFASGSLDTHHITFDHCVFKTPSYPASDLVNFYNSASRFHDITFSNCWFEPCHLFTIEFNSRLTGWGYNIYIDHCTFEQCDASAQGWGGPISMDHGSDNGTLPMVNGVPRFWENVNITNNLFYGSAECMVEMRGFAPLAGSEATTRSRITGNKFGRAKVVMFSFGHAAGTSVYATDSGAKGVHFEDNLFDESFDPGGLGADSLKGFWRTPVISPYPRGQMNDCVWWKNTFNLWPQPDYQVGVQRNAYIDCLGGDNVFSGNTWTSSTGTSMDTARAGFPMTTTTYTGETFDLPGELEFASDAVGSGCTFTPRCTRTGGTFT